MLKSVEVYIFVITCKFSWWCSRVFETRHS